MGDSRRASSGPGVLYLTCHLPYPPHSGGRLRDHELLRRTPPGLPLHLVVISKTYEQDLANRAALEPYCASVTMLRAEPPGVGPGPGVARLEWLHRCPAARAVVAELCASGQVDVLHVESYYLMQHVPPVLQPVLLVAENVEYAIEEQRGRLGAPGTSWASVAAERRAWRRPTVCAALSREDQVRMQRDAPGLRVRLVPEGADHLSAATDLAVGAVGGAGAAFVGNYGYAPTADAARCLLEDVWPRVRAAAPTARLVLAGANAPDWVVAADGRAGVEVRGPVPTVLPILRAADLVLIPLRLGGGIKVKVVEALWAGRPVVTTPVGAQGLPPAAVRAMAVAGSSAGLAAATVRLLASATERQRYAAAAAAAAATLPTWDDAAAALQACWRQLAGAGSGLGATATAGDRSGDPLTEQRSIRSQQTVGDHGRAVPTGGVRGPGGPVRRMEPGERRPHAGGQGDRVSAGHENADLVGDVVLRPAAPGGHERGAAAQRLHARHAERLKLARHHRDMRRGEHGGDGRPV